MHGPGKSDRSVVPKKASNKVRPAEPFALAPSSGPDTTAEMLEGRDRTKGNTQERNRHRTQSRERLQQVLERVRQVAWTHAWRHT
jgi:hypothetical protein